MMHTLGRLLLVLKMASGFKELMSKKRVQILQLRLQSHKNGLLPSSGPFGRLYLSYHSSALYMLTELRVRHYRALYISLIFPKFCEVRTKLCLLIFFTPVTDPKPCAHIGT